MFVFIGSKLVNVNYLEQILGIVKVIIGSKSPS